MGVWADVFYAKNEAKEIYGDFGYSADIYGGVLGFDYTAACGGTLGAALTVGTADADSDGGVLSTSLSSDFVGLSVYASKDFSGLNVKADLGYIDFSNDFTVSATPPTPRRSRSVFAATSRPTRTAPSPSFRTWVFATRASTPMPWPSTTNRT